MDGRMARAGVAVAAVASLGLGYGLVAVGPSAGAATAAASSAGQPGQTIDELVANTEAALNNAEAEVSPDVMAVESVACFALEVALGEGPPYPPPGSCEID